MGGPAGALKSWGFWAATAALCAVSLEALAAYAHETGSEAWTEVAGAKTESSIELVATADYYALRTLKVWEYDARPCVLQIEQGSFNTRSLGVLEPVKVCEPKASETWKRADVGAGRFVTGISVCSAQSKDEGPAIHGLSLSGATLEHNGKLKPSGLVKFEFSHCEKWSARRSCPWGSVATGLRAYIPDSERGVVGIALRCHKLETR